VARAVVRSLRVPLSLRAGLSCDLAGAAGTEHRADTSPVPPRSVAALLLMIS